MLTTSKDPIFDYLKLLHDHGVGSKEAEEFKRQFLLDSQSKVLARGAERLFAEKDAILGDLEGSNSSESHGS